jgi:hypothetical protein
VGSVNKLTRRGFIHTSVGAASGLAAAGALGAAGAMVGPDRNTPLAKGSPQPMVAYVSNASRGEISLLVGDREVTYHDSDLVRRLIKAAG